MSFGSRWPAQASNFQHGCASGNLISGARYPLHGQPRFTRPLKQGAVRLGFGVGRMAGKGRETERGPVLHGPSPKQSQSDTATQDVFLAKGASKVYNKFGAIMQQSTVRPAGPILHGALSRSAYGLRTRIFSAPSRATARAALLSSPRLNRYNIGDRIESAKRGLTEEGGGRLCIFGTLIHECL